MSTLLEQANSDLKPIDIVTCPIDTSNEFVGLSPCRQIARLFLQKLGYVLREGVGCPAPECQCRSRHITDLMGRDIADQSRQFFFEIGAVSSIRTCSPLR